MGFWSSLAKWGPKIGGYVAAPFTGGASIAVGEALSGLGQVAGAAGAAASQGRADQAQFNLQQDKLKQDAYQTDLTNRATLPKTFARQAAIGDVMANYDSGDYLKNIFSAKDLSSLMSSYSSAPRGYTGTTARQAQGELSRQAMANLLSPPKAPTLTAYPKAGWGEKILGGVGLGASLLGAFGKPQANNVAKTGS